MTTQELHDALIDLEIVEGYAIRDGLIVDWSNAAAIPESLEDYVALEMSE